MRHTREDGRTEKLERKRKKKRATSKRGECEKEENTKLNTNIRK